MRRRWLSRYRRAIAKNSAMISRSWSCIMGAKIRRTDVY
jgi:hypothetical protein